MVSVERIGSFEKHGEYWRIELAVNGRRLAPLWMSAPEFLEYEGSSDFWDRLAAAALMADEQARVAMGVALTEILSRRHANGPSDRSRETRPQA